MKYIVIAIIVLGFLSWYAYHVSSINYASWYGKAFHGKLTTNGETYDMNAMTAAHKTLPFNTYVVVTLWGTDQSVIVRINDRGPFIKGRDIDLSRAAAKELGILDVGVAKVKLRILN